MAEDNIQVEIAQLVAEHYQSVYSLCVPIEWLSTEAEDLTQQVYLIASRNLRQLRSLDSAKIGCSRFEELFPANAKCPANPHDRSRDWT